MIFPATYFAMDPDGTFRETERGSMSWNTILDDICSGQYEVVRVFKAHGPVWSDVTEAMVDQVYSRVVNGTSEFIPSFLELHDHVSCAALRSHWMHPVQRRHERAENYVEAAA